MRPLYTLVGALLLGCTVAQPSHIQTVEAYYAGFNAGDFSQVDAVVADSFTVIAGDYITPYDRAANYVMFQWDSVFVTTYDIEHIEAYGDSIRVRIASESNRYAFLENNPLTCDMTFAFSEEKISFLRVGDCSNANWDVWAARRDSLVAWTDSHHPELSGFINDLTKEGAENYMKAIAFYTSQLP